MNREKKSLGMNTIMLYLLMFSNYFFGFATVPYQTRVLGPEIYGIIGFASAIMVYFQLVLDFGFILSATQHVAQNAENRTELGRLLTDIFVCKLLLGAACVAVLYGICVVVPAMQEHRYLYLLYLAGALVNSLLPDFLYRGLQKMQAITYRTIAVKGFFTVMIFVLLKDRSQYYVIPVLNLLGSIGAVAWSYWDVAHKLGIHMQKSTIWSAMKEMRVSTPFFISRIASTVYGATNSVVLKALYPTGVMLGYYTCADKVVSLARSASSPIADSLYPYMIKNKDFRMVKKIMGVLMPLIVVGGVVLWIIAEPFCQFIFGVEYAGVGRVLRCLIPIMITVLPTYVMGFPILSPLGLERYANLSNIIGAVVQIAGLILLYLLRELDVYSVCLMTCITEATVLTYRCLVVVRHTRRMRSNKL